MAVKNKKVKKSIEAALAEYLRRLNAIPDELFNKTPPAGGWSYGEVYSHIMQANLGSLIAAEKCVNGTGKTDNSTLSLLARFVFLINQFPPVKFKAPAKIAAQVVNCSKNDARAQIIKTQTKLNELAPLIGSASLNCKIKHPRLGMLNAVQWYRFIDIHTRHHLKQLERLDKSFKRNKTFDN